MTTALRFDRITKSFPGVKALDGVSFEVAAGSVHGLLGENGAGKSTLLKILGGEYRPDSGELFVHPHGRRFAGAADAIAAGVAVIHQELQFVPDLSVTENLLLGHLPHRGGFVRGAQAEAFVRRELRAMGIDLDPRARLYQLSVAQRQMVEICKALLRQAEVIALDEPTSSLSYRETQTLFRLVRDLRARGKALIYVSHRLDEIFALCDGCTVFRDGRVAARHASLEGVTRETLVREMVGRELGDVYRYRPRPLGGVRLAVRGLTGARLPQPADFTARAGEIVGFFGLVGAGRSELARLVFGADRPTAGTVLLDGRAQRIRCPADAIRQGIVFCPEDRKQDGIIAVRSVSENINVSCRRHHLRAGFFCDARREAAVADGFIRRLRIRTPHRRQPIRLLSGGNQQKAILARWLAEPDLKVVIMDEPTRGIDVGARHEIYQIIDELAGQGCTVILVSSDLPEVLGISDRVVVMRGGRIAGELLRAAASEEAILGLALPASGEVTTR